MDGKTNRTQQGSVAAVLKVIKWARYFWCFTPLNTLHGSFVDFNVITPLFLRTNTVTSFVFTCKFDPFSNTELAFQIYVISHTFQVTPLKFDNFWLYDPFLPTYRRYIYNVKAILSRVQNYQIFCRYNSSSSHLKQNIWITLVKILTFLRISNENTKDTIQ